MLYKLSWCYRYRNEWIMVDITFVLFSYLFFLYFWYNILIFLDLFTLIWKMLMVLLSALFLIWRSSYYYLLLQITLFPRSILFYFAYFHVELFKYNVTNKIQRSVFLRHLFFFIQSMYLEGLYMYLWTQNVYLGNK